MKPRLVPLQQRPALRPVTAEDAARLYPQSYWLQQRYLRAIYYLRERSKCGWYLDAGSTPQFRSDHTA